MITKIYRTAIKELKQMILSSRYKAASLANSEMLVLYFGIGKYIAEKSREDAWGTGMLDILSSDLQKELPGLRGFSATNLKRMRIFFEAWESFNEIRPLLTDDLRKLPKKYLQKSNSSNRPLLTDDLKSAFCSISFTHHSVILSAVKDQKERLFYIQQTAANFWSVTNLEHQINAKLFKKQGKLPNNFNKAIANDKLREKALQTFKDEYLLDFINIEDAEFADEREIENQIVRNIKNFILSIGNDFAFIGNQYRLVIEDEEWFVDLLFYNRKLQSLVAFELKKGKFKPEYLGKMNFYLSALDEMVKQPHENPSIGIILCKSKTDKIVEFSFRNFNKPMGVATYKTSKELPAKYKGILPDAKTLKKLLD